MSLNEALFKLLWFMAIGVIVWMLVVNMIGCSAVEAISKDSTSIQTIAQSSESRFVTISDLTDDKQIKSETKYGVAEQQEIQDLSAHIVSRLPQVEDKVPSWMVTLQWLAIAGISIATLLILWQTGIGNLVRKLLYSISWFIPPSKKREVEMDMKVADPENHMTHRELVAHKRSDTAYDSAYKLYWRNKP